MYNVKSLQHKHDYNGMKSEGTKVEISEFPKL